MWTLHVCCYAYDILFELKALLRGLRHCVNKLKSGLLKFSENRCLWRQDCAPFASRWKLSVHCCLTMPSYWCSFYLLSFVCLSYSSPNFFSNSFLVRFKRNVDPQEAHIVAHRNGFVNMGQVTYINRCF